MIGATIIIHREVPKVLRIRELEIDPNDSDPDTVKLYELFVDILNRKPASLMVLHSTTYVSQDEWNKRAPIR